MSNLYAATWGNHTDFFMVNPFMPGISKPINGPLIRQPWYFENQSTPTASTLSFEGIQLQRALSKFASYLIENSRDIEPEYVKIVEENFWDLLA